MKGAEATFNLSFSLWAGRNQMGDPQRCEGTLELRTGISSIGGGLMAEEGQTIGVQGRRQALSSKGGAKVLEMMPSRTPASRNFFSTAGAPGIQCAC